MRSLLKLAITSLFLCACGGAISGGTYSDRAQAAYANALEDYFDDDCMDAEPLFHDVRRKYPYSRFAALAELRAADCMYKESKYPEAIQAYQQFVRYRPSHSEVPYARFQIGRAHFKQIPSEWLLSPPAYERDQRFTHDAVRLLRRFILDFPDHALVQPAKEMVNEAVHMLAAHEFYVANFYLDDDAPEAAVGRLQTLLRSYGGSDFETEALLLLGDTLEELKDVHQARQTYNELVQHYPDSEEASEARERLQTLGG